MRWPPCIYALAERSARAAGLLMVSQGWRYTFAPESAAPGRCGLSASKKAYNNASINRRDLATYRPHARLREF